MKVLVLGGDGFCGWPTSLQLSKNGHDVTIIDDFPRRIIMIEITKKCSSRGDLTRIPARSKL